MTFVSVPEERFATDILKTWVDLFKSDNAFAGITFLVKQPDIDVQFKIPTVVLKRVSEETWSLSRLSGDFGPRNNTDDDVNILRGYTYMTTYQLDIYGLTITDTNRIMSLVTNKLKSPDGSDVFADGRVQETLIPLKDYDGNVPGTATDLNMKFRFRRDVDGIEVPTFDPELHQYSISVTFWLDYLNEYTFPRIKIISPTVELI